MWGLLLSILKSIVTAAAKNTALKFLHPHLLKLDKWCEDKLGIDIIKQDKKFKDKWPLVNKRLEDLEVDSHPPKCLEEFEDFQKIDARLKEIERRLRIKN